MKTNILFITALISLFLFSCKHPEPVVEQSHFPAEVETIIRTSCTHSSCHNGQEEGAFDLTSWNTSFLGAEGTGADIVPYNANWSHMFQHVNQFSDLGLMVSEDDQMPPLPYEKLSREDILVLRQWITDGAKSDKGESYWANRETSTHDKLFVLCSGSDLIAVIDIPTNKIMRYIPVGVIPDITESPHYIKLSPDGQYIYVTLIQGGLIEKYRTDNYTFVGRVQVSGQPSLMAVNSDGSRLVVTHWNEDDQTPKVSLIDANAMQVLATAVTDALRAHGLAVTDDFRTIYVTPNNGNFYARYTLNAALNDFVDQENYPLDPVNDPIPSPSNKFYPYQALLDQASTKLYITCSNANEVRVFNTITNALISTIPVDSFPRQLIHDKDHNRIFVACAKTKNVQEQGSIRGSVVVINTQSLTVEKKIYNLGHRPHGLKLDKERNYLFVSSENTGGIDPPHHPTQGTLYPPGKVNIVDLTTLEVLLDKKTDVAEFPTSIEVTE